MVSNQRTKTSIRRLGFTLIVMALISAGVIAYYGKQLAQPRRAELEDYHHAWLKEPDQHGIFIDSSSYLDGKVPCLVVTPNASAQLGERGILIRKQMAERGHHLEEIGTIRGNIVLLHGRNGRKENLLPVAERFCALGIRCIIPDLPAHGESPVKTVHFGSSDWEQNLPHTLLLECAAKHQFTPYPSALWGMSMGGSFATHSAATRAPWSSLVIVSSFDRLGGVIQNKCKHRWFTSALSWSCKQFGGADITQVNPCEKSANVTIPVLVAHGTNDDLIHLSQGKSLFHSFASKEKSWVTVKGGNHKNVLTTPMPLYATMVEWILDHLPHQITPNP